MQKEKEDVSKADVEWVNKDEGVLTEFEYKNLYDGDVWQGYRTVKSKYIIKSDVCVEQLKNLNLSLKNVSNQMVDNQNKLTSAGEQEDLSKDEKKIRKILFKVGKNEEIKKLSDAMKALEEQEKKYKEMIDRVEGYLKKIPNETSR